MSNEKTKTIVVIREAQGMYAEDGELDDTTYYVVWEKDFEKAKKVIKESIEEWKENIDNEEWVEEDEDNRHYLNNYIVSELVNAEIDWFYPHIDEFIYV